MFKAEKQIKLKKTSPLFFKTCNIIVRNPPLEINNLRDKKIQQTK